MIEFTQVGQHQVKVTASTPEEMRPINYTFIGYGAQQWGQISLGGVGESFGTYAFFQNQTDILALREIYPIPAGITLWDKAEAERESEEREQQRLAQLIKEKYNAY